GDPLLPAVPARTARLAGLVPLLPRLDHREQGDLAGGGAGAGAGGEHQLRPLDHARPRQAGGLEPQEPGAGRLARDGDLAVAAEVEVLRAGGVADRGVEGDAGDVVARVLAEDEHARAGRRAVPVEEGAAVVVDLAGDALAGGAVLAAQRQAGRK